MKRIFALVLTIALILSSCNFLGVDTDINESPSANEATFVDHSTITPEEANTSENAKSYVKSLVSELVDKLELAEMDSETAIKTAYEYVVTNYYFADPVGLDVWRYLSDEVDPIPYIENRSLSPLLFGIASCEDFAAIMVMIFSEIGIEAKYVAGYTLSVEQVYIDHAWLVVKLDDNWYHLDPQLEYNVVRDSKLQYRFFMKTDVEMIFDHKWGENLISHWPEMQPEEINNVRENYLVPACNTKYTPPQPIGVEMPHKPDYIAINNEIDGIKESSKKGELSPIILNIEPPILVKRYHITPPLLPQYYNIRQSENVGYGRSLLNQSEIKAYDQLFEVLTNTEKTNFTFTPSLSDESAKRVVSYLIDDCPQFFWAELTPINESYNSIEIFFKGGLTKEVVDSQISDLESKLIAIEQETSGKTDYETLLTFYDFVGTTAKYGYKSVDSDNAYGAIVNGTASCNGYSRAFQYLANGAGIKNMYIRGSDKKGTAHAWNAVMLDGSWYYIDVTWGRSSTSYGGTYHDFFCISLEEALRSRVWDESQYLSPLPSSNSDKYDFYKYHTYSVNVDNSATLYKQIDQIAKICNNQLALKNNLEDSYSYAFVELKAFGDESDYQKWKSLYTKELFSILKAMEADAKERNLPFSISTNTEVSCYYNDTLQVVSFYPKVKKNNI